ncbi:SEC-C metal-binding domain-containing protein [Nitrosomonas sp. Nm33]|uniref:SEC-C metal-binding domain-containing protein n=1 Tax=Nitrosomonas sp. Nm33 TaxID=133724 RepID=UPI0015A4A0D9|nr:SEC-C metal-binding domain-containing protein [Nitrosomonas sp. Nm33]
MLKHICVSEKLDNPVMIEWAIDILESIPIKASSEHAALASEWFHDLFLLRQIENNDIDILPQLFRNLPTERLASLSNMILDRWLQWPGKLALEATPHLAKFHPNALITLFEKYLENVENGEPLDLYRITAMEHAAHLGAKKQYAPLAEKLCTLILASSDDALFKTMMLSSVLSFADVLSPESLQSILGTSLQNKQNNDQKENLLEQLFSGLFGHSAYFELVLDRREGISTQRIEETRDLFRAEAPLDFLDQCLDKYGSSTDLIKILEQAHQPGCKTFLTLIQPKNVLVRNLNKDMLYDATLAACLHAYELDDFNSTDKDLNHTLALLAINLNWLPQFDRLIARLKTFPRQETIHAMVDLLAKTAMTYGGVHLAKAMGELQFEEFVPCLIDSLSEESGDFLHETAEESLKAIGTKAQEALIERWDTLDFSQRIYGLSTISDIGGKHAADFAVRYFSDLFADDSERWCQLALSAPDSRMLDLLKPHLKRKQPWIDHAFYVLSRLLERHDPLLEKVEKRVLDDYQTSKLRRESFERGDFFRDFLSLKLRCPECHEINLYHVKGIVVSPTAAEESKTSTTLIADEIPCLSCGKDVEFELTPEANMSITAQMMIAAADKHPDWQKESLISFHDCTLDGQVMSMAEGLKIAREYINRNPGDVNHWYILGTLLLNLNRPKAAKDAFERLLQIDPYMANVRLEVAKLLIAQGNEAEAFEMLIPILENRPLWKTIGNHPHFNQNFINTYNLLRRKLKRDDLPIAHPASLTAPAKVGRNDPCPCGSGKKYKKCCGT